MEQITCGAFGVSQGEVFMPSASLWMVTVIILLSPLWTADAQTYRDELERGIAAYKENHYEQAIAHFRMAAEIDPDEPTAHFYLATAYASQCIPGVDLPDNLEMAELAVKEYERVLASDATAESKFSSAKGIAYLYQTMKRFDEARFYYEKASGFEPDDPEPYYSIGALTGPPAMNPE
jgi:Flp pilus assembly protein TadD